MRLALYQPDIPPNVGTMLRLCACLRVPVDIIEPCGFPFSDKRLKRAGLDYLDAAEMTRHVTFDAFLETIAGRRLVLMSTRGDIVHHAFRFTPSDVVMMGREQSGVPDTVHARADARLRVPMASGLRSLNIAVTAGIAITEALRQIAGFPGEAGEAHEPRPVERRSA
ncbi:tRNA (cytidine(34)-2'-O)-methyltransferase [Desertibaculum subflavum]|uniref:tRNA (cytidine(34)-2'-O)-methyltransferase n=1 Tax=Desertibaculum subflavum TaxID=2268458 RepID=UPI000E664CD2